MVSSTVSRNVVCSSLRPINRTAEAAQASSWRYRHQPIHKGSVWPRSSNDFRVMPAAKVASTPLASRPRDSAQPGSRGDQIEAHSVADVSEFMRHSKNQLCALWCRIGRNRTPRLLLKTTDNVALSFVMLFI